MRRGASTANSPTRGRRCWPRRGGHLRRADARLADTGGTSAHFVGGAFAAILLGPHLGALCVATVVTVQALVFGDGGIVVPARTCSTWPSSRCTSATPSTGRSPVTTRFAAAFAAGWLGITAARAQRGRPLRPVVGVRLRTRNGRPDHGRRPPRPPGLIEGAITAVVYRAVVDARPDVLPASPLREVRA